MEYGRYQSNGSAICTRRIALVEDVKPNRQMQRRLNPTMTELVKGELLKFLDVGIIYPIASRKLVSPIHVVSKMSGVTVVHNENGEIVTN